MLDRQLATFGGGRISALPVRATLVRALLGALKPVTRVEVLGPRGEGAPVTCISFALQTYALASSWFARPASDRVLPCASHHVLAPRDYTRDARDLLR